LPTEPAEYSPVKGKGGGIFCPIRCRSVRKSHYACQNMVIIAQMNGRESLDLEIFARTRLAL
jgi:hypothetical protein